MCTVPFLFLEFLNSELFCSFYLNTYLMNRDAQSVSSVNIRPVLFRLSAEKFGRESLIIIRTELNKEQSYRVS